MLSLCKLSCVNLIPRETHSLQRDNFRCNVFVLLWVIRVHLNLNLRPSSRLEAECMKVPRNIFKYPPDALWKDHYAVICFSSSTEAVFDLGTMTLLFPVLASPVLSSTPVLSTLNDSVLEPLLAQERCFPALRRVALHQMFPSWFFFGSGVWLKGRRVRNRLKPQPQGR